MIEREFVKEAVQDVKIKEFLDRKLKRAVVSRIEIRRTPLVTRIILHVQRPGVVIGRRGGGVRALTEEIKEKFGIENPQIEVVQVEEPIFDATIQAKRIAMALEAGVRWKPLINRVLGQILGAGAKGAEIIIKGKLAGKGAKARKVRVWGGYLKKVGDPARLVDYAKVPAETRWGVIGVRVRIVHPDTRFPDEITIPEIRVEENEGEGAQSNEQ